MTRFIVCFAVLMTAALLTGCVAKVEREARPMFDAQPLDACLVLNVDLSSSFADDFGERAYPLLLRIMTEFFQAQSGARTKVVLSQMSGHDEVVLFEGTPRELGQRFAGPDALSAFLLSKSDPARSPIYQAMGETLRYVNAMPDVTSETKLLTVTISDMKESESDQTKRKAAGGVLAGELERYRERGGAVALYYVALDETDRWRRIFDRTGFEPGQFVIANTLSENPPLPRLY